MDKGVFFILFVVQESRLCFWAFNKIQILIFFSDKKFNGYSLLCVLLDSQINLETYIKVYEPNIRLSHCDIVFCSWILASLRNFCYVLHVTCSFVTFFCNISHVMGLTTLLQFQ